MKNQIFKNNKIYLFLTVSALILSGFVFAPALQKPISEVQAQSVGSFFDVFLEIDGIQGSSSHNGAIDILSWSWGASNPTTVGGGGAGSGKVSMHDISITKKIDKASPLLYSFAKSGKRVKNMVLTVSNGGSDYLKIKMSDVMVSSYGLSGQGNNQPIESVSFNFSKITVDYVVAGSLGN